MMGFAAKHFGRKGAAATAHHLRLSNYFVKKNTFAQELPSTTTEPAFVIGNKTFFPSPMITETTRHGKIGVMAKPEDLGSGYMAFVPTKAGGRHFTGRYSPSEFSSLLSSKPPKT